MTAKDMRHFVDGGFYGVNSYGINRDRSMLAVTLAIAVHYLEGPFFDVEGFKGFGSVPTMACIIRFVFLAFSLSQNEQTGLPYKNGVMVRCLLPGFILDGLLARDRHTKPDRLFSALNEPSLAVPVLQRGDRPYWNFAERALN